MPDPYDQALTGDDSDDGTPQSGDVIAGKYRVDNVVGRGGMGIVLAARHLQLGQAVAIKVLSVQGLDADRRREAAARFLREGQAAARLTSDHVVRIHDFGTLESGAPFMVMELLRGDDLANLILQHGPAPVEVAVDYVVQACDAVAEAHRMGIVHRDLKPSNLFVTRRNDGPAFVKVLDFGISKAMSVTDGFEGNLTATRTVVGSPFYMSPEQVRDAKRVDARADIWSLGMIFYELIVGRPAFHADTLPGICAAIAADIPTPIAVHRDGVPPEVEAIVMKCLEKDPAKRFQTIAELVRALSQFGPKSAAPSIEYASRPIDMLSSVGFGSAMVPSPTIQELPPPRTNTLPSPAAAVGPRIAAEVTMPALVTVAKSRSETEKTVLSGASTLVSGPGKETAGTEPNGVREPRRLVRPAIAVVVALAVAAVMALRPRSDAPPSDARTAGPSRFVLAIESTPEGATVMDGDTAMGKTPLSLSIDNGRVAASPRTFVLTLDGFDPYTIVQGPSDSSVRVLATLTKGQPRTPPSASPPTAATGNSPVAPNASSPSPVRALGHVSSARKKPSQPVAAPPSDIRLER